MAADTRFNGEFAKTAPSISPSDRQYYIATFGFDPVKNLMANTKQGNLTCKYETFFRLLNDPELDVAGVQIGARVAFSSDKRKIQNRIVFAKGNIEGCVTCVHTAICSIDAEQAFSAEDRDLIEMARTSEGKQIILTPEEHFVSLKSYVEGITALGIKNILGASYYTEGIDPESLPIGFNSAMQSQIIKALRAVAPSATDAIVREFMLNLSQVVPSQWFDDRFGLFNRLYNIDHVLFLDPAVF
ncbi:MAG TPA: hypothetical protein VKK79_23510, partial [Candidatus Lokiarchaeia archaeon]|nr:hypothetical protein [Candidatus Lokiarchaeia archaeon]